jgi:hypothetical protein
MDGTRTSHMLGRASSEAHGNRGATIGPGVRFVQDNHSNRAGLPLTQAEVLP